MSEVEARSNLKIVGTTNSVGGYFKDIRVTGECQFTGDVDCKKLKLTGNASVFGSLRAEKMKITGEVVIEGKLEGSSMSGQGEIRAAAVRTDQLHLHGNLEVHGDCVGEKLEISGALSVAGLLSAEHLEINLFGPCKAKEIGGSTIVIRRNKKGKLLHLMKPNQIISFEADLIEGDTIELNCTKADVVRGERVFIGPECVIERVEYRESLEIHNNATVKHQVKI